MNSITYYQLLSMYDEQLRGKIQSLHSALLNDNVFLFELEMMPENLHWKYDPSYLDSGKTGTR